MTGRSGILLLLALAGPEVTRGVEAGEPICNDIVHAIPPSNPVGTISVIEIPCPDVTITDLNVLVQITHTWVGDLRAELTHASTGTSAMLFNRPGLPAPNTGCCGCSGNNIDATLSDEATNPVETTCAMAVPTIQGTFIAGDPPDPTLLASFDGEELCGTWHLHVVDIAGGGDIGSLTNWCLIPTAGQGDGGGDGGGPDDGGGDPVPATTPAGTLLLVLAALGASAWFLRPRSAG